MVEKIREWPTAHVIDAEGEYVLRDPVRINDAELDVEQIRGLEMGEGGRSYSDAKARSVFVRRASDGANRTQFGRKEGFSVRHVSESSIDQRLTPKPGPVRRAIPRNYFAQAT